MRLVALDDDVSSNHSSSHDPNEECAVCLALLFRPVRTSCEHLFCSACWDQHAARSGDDSAEPPAPLCPLCRTEATVAPDLGLGLKLQQQHPAEWARREDSFRKQGVLRARCPAWEPAVPARAPAHLTFARQTPFADSARMRPPRCRSLARSPLSRAHPSRACAARAPSRSRPPCSCGSGTRLSRWSTPPRPGCTSCSGWAGSRWTTSSSTPSAATREPPTRYRTQHARS
ncbi:hypothetical protein EMIHUDRAFT_465472 [Emiliania huxleyi CCMP1516]|uniref:RING-type domain-containing protein n=2 Tax=Emiliania huxleyi TaxID=2903 RepID=A0A0D3ICU7_EMIH1|nr:hypothetical protein EMIHUDRAFT_465472 [Emiliania huxleyi CCMP1516]EOD09082.1 hypothetical protein EMIHUDRAFT_465472 [Emiliania huxleyi CCMP1516]|eukprot:XP_005761511.1 hypothetical protein EMIHUDRAFT_465472 [Emiliania huxleyi CCMP1516]